MIRLMPRNLDELSRVSGVGQAKLEKYGERFLGAISGFLMDKAA